MEKNNNSKSASILGGQQTGLDPGKSGATASLSAVVALSWSLMLLLTEESIYQNVPRLHSVKEKNSLLILMIMTVKMRTRTGSYILMKQGKMYTQKNGMVVMEDIRNSARILQALQKLVVGKKELSGVKIWTNLWWSAILSWMTLQEETIGKECMTYRMKLVTLN